MYTPESGHSLTKLTEILIFAKLVKSVWLKFFSCFHFLEAKDFFFLIIFNYCFIINLFINQWYESEFQINEFHVFLEIHFFFSGLNGKKKSAISHLHEGRSSSVTHLAGVVMQRVIVDCAIFPVLDLEEAWTLGGASVLGCCCGWSLALRSWLQGRRNLWPQFHFISVYF